MSRALAAPAAVSPAAVSVANTGRWLFDAGTGTSAADSVGSHPATLSSGASWTAGIQGAYALGANGLSAAAVTSTSVVNTASSFSVTAWAKLSSTTGTQTVVAQDGTQVSGFQLGLQSSTGKFGFVRLPSDATATPTTFPSAAAAPVAGQWYQLAGVYNASANTLALYVNGRLQQTTAAPTAWSATGAFTVGRGKSGGAATNWFNGSIDDVAAYSGALSSSDVDQIAEAGRWRFDEGTGTSASDDSINAYTSTLSGGPGWTTGVQAPTALSVTGAGQASAAAPVLDASKSFTVAAWVKLSALGGYQTFVSQDSSAVSSFYLQLRGDTGKFAFVRLGSDSTTAAGMYSGAASAPVTGQWYHLVGVYDSVAKTLALYVNGVLQGTTSDTTGWKGTGNLVIGRGYFNGATDYWSGALDDVRAYRYVLDATSITALATSVPPAPSAPTATPGNGSAAVSWTAPSDVSGAPVTGYTVTPYVNGVAQTAQTFTSTATSQTVTGLTNGTSYTFTVSAINANGTSPQSAQSSAVTPVTTPGAPTITVATAGSSSATLSWSAPSGNGGSAVTGYVVTPYIGSTAQTARTFSSTATTQTVSGLTAGTAYTFTVAAVNAVGTGTASAQSSAVTPYTTSGAPSITTATAGNASATLSWSAPTSNGGSAVTGYVVTPYVGSTAQAAQTFSSTATSQTVTGLTNGTAYTFTVAAVNAAGTGTASAQSSSVTPYTTPGAPTITAATAGARAATLTWSAPTSTSGNPVTGYVVTPYIGSTAQTAQTFSSTATTQTVTGLTAGTAYTFTVAATNAAGTGTASAQSAAVTPYTTPGAPTVTSATAGAQAATLSWSAPTSNGGNAVTGYTVTPYIGTTAQPVQTFVSTATTQTVTGLTAGTAYTFTVAAINAAGAGTPSAQSGSVTPYTTPGAPTITAATAGTQAATLSWSAPTSNGGSAVTGYVVTPYIGSTAQPATTFSSTATTQTMTGLTAGTAYTFTVAATNAAGTGTPSTQSSSVTPYTTPGAPTITSAAAGAQAATLSWSAPSSNGGSAVTGYVVTPYIGTTAQAARTFASTATTQTVTGLTAGTAYTFTVAATNAAGTGSPSAQSASVTPYTTPGAPTITAATAGSSSATLSWSAPSSNGGNAVTGYTVTPYIGTTAQPVQTFVSTATTQTVTGLTAGTAYTFTVAAVNAAGSGTPSAKSSTVTPYTTPGAPNSPSVTPGVNSATLSWSAPSSNGGSAITGYVVTPYIGTTAQTASTFNSTATTQTLTGLLAGTQYTFTVAAVNVAGTGSPSSASSAVTVQAGTAHPEVLYRINAGGPQVAANDAGPDWAADPDNNPTLRDNSSNSAAFSGAVTPDSTVPPSTPLSVLLDERWDPGTNGDGGEMKWHLPVSAGTPVQVRLYFINLCDCTNQVGQRQFDVAVEGATVLSRFDPVQATGGTRIGTMRSFNVVSDGTVNIDFTHEVENPLIDAIEVVALPSAPATPTATAGAGSATLSWAAPSGNGAAISGYVVTPYKDGVAQTPISYDASSTNRTLTGLTVGSSYTFTVAAVSSVGTGPPSSPTAAVTPYTTPAAPTVTAATASTNGATLTWSPPPSDGGSPVTGYVVTPYIGTTAQPVQTFVSTATTQTVTGLTAGTPYTFTVAAINAAGAGTPSAQSSTVTPNPAPTVSGTPTAGEVGVAYSYAMAVTGGTGPYTWSVSSGSLPPGVSLSSSTGALSGTPTSAGTRSLTVRVTDAAGVVATRAVSIAVAAQPTLTSVPPNGRFGVDYGTFQFSPTGGTAPFSYSIVSGSLPSGMTLSSAGVLSGQSHTIGSFPFTVQVVDADNQTATDPVTLTIGPAPVQVQKTASVSAVAPGGTVTYTVTVTNSSGQSYAGVQIDDPLSGVLDDATYNTDAAVNSGSTSYSGSTLTWRVDAVTGATETLTYSVTVAKPDTGNQVLSATLSTSYASTNCAPGYQDNGCSAAVAVAGLSIATSPDVTSTTPGSVVHYTTTVTNTGQNAYASATVSDALSGLLDDATYNTDGAATSGSVSFSSPTLRWSGALAVGASATITYSVTVRNPDSGDRTLSHAVTSSDLGSGCPVGGSGSSCSSTTTVLVPALTFSSLLSDTSTTPGSVVRFTVTATNTGQTAYSGISFTDAVGGILDDANYNYDATTSTGTLSFPDAMTLQWTGSLAVGASVTVTGTVTVKNPDPGDKVMRTVITSSAAGNNCASGSTDPACMPTVAVKIPQLSLTSGADVSTTTPGSTVHYTVTVSNTGQTDYTGAAFSVPLSGVLDDATYAGDAAATAGTASYASGTLSWSWNLAMGASSKITYSVVVRSPDPGDLTLASTLTSSTAGSTCPAGTTAAACRTSVQVLIPALTVATSSDVASATPGDVIHYTMTLTNSGQTAYASTSATLDLTGATDDATYWQDATASAGSLSSSGGVLTWTGALAVGAVVTVTATVTVNNPDTGNRAAAVAAASPAAGSTCPVGGGGTAACTTSVTVLIPALQIVKTADTASATPGSRVTYTVTATNTGQTAYQAATLNDSLARVLTDATYDADATATSGTVSYSSATLAWTGALAIGASATITYSVTVQDPDPGDKTMVNTVVSSSPGSTCPSGGSDTRCTAVVSVVVPALTVSMTSDSTTTTPGATVHYTLTATNSGQTAYAATSFSAALAGVLDDASYNGDATVGSGGGTASYASGSMSWSGALAVGAAVTVTYSVTVSKPDKGDTTLRSAVTSTAAGSNCAAGSTDTRCSVSVPVAQLDIVQSFTTATATPSSVVRLNTTYTNIGSVPYTGITIGTNRADVTDDAMLNGDQTATSGTITVTPTTFAWSGDIPVGGAVTVTRTLTIRNPDTGNRVLSTTMLTAAAGQQLPHRDHGSPVHLDAPRAAARPDAQHLGGHKGGSAQRDRAHDRPDRQHRPDAVHGSAGERPAAGCPRRCQLQR